MKIELRNSSDIKPYPGNPRLTDSAVDAVARSLQEFGFRQPIVVDKDGVIVAGHARWTAAQKLGLKQVPVHVAKDLADDIQVPEVGVEPTHTCVYWILSPARLPFRHSG